MDADESWMDLAVLDSLACCLGNEQLIPLLEEFAQLLAGILNEINHTTNRTDPGLKFMAIKLRGTAAEYGAQRLVKTARLVEQCVAEGAGQFIDWRWRLKGELSLTISAYEAEIMRRKKCLSNDPKARSRLKSENEEIASAEERLA